MSPHEHVFDVTTADFQQRVLEASHSTPVLVDFWADWCGPCKALAPVLEKLAAESEGAFVLAKVDTDVERELAMANGVRSLPTVRLFVDGAPVAEFMGAQPESAVRAFLEQHLPQLPAQADDALEQVAALLDAGELEAARRALAGLEEQQVASARGQSLRARLALLEESEQAPCEAELRERLASDAGDLDARFLLALRDALAGRHGDAMEALLGILSRNRGFREDGARRALLQVFDMLGAGDPLVANFRRRLASTLN